MTDYAKIPFSDLFPRYFTGLCFDGQRRLKHILEQNDYSVSTAIIVGFSVTR